MTLICGENDGDRRLDRVLRKALEEQPLSLIHRLLRQGKVRVNGKTAAASDRVEAGSEITVEIPGAAPPIPHHAPLREKTGALKIIWQGPGLLVLNKAGGIAVHGRQSLETLVRAHLAGTLPPSLSFRPGPLHRLDKPTSGLIVFSANIRGARFFSSLMRRGLVKKQYLAILEGRIDTDQVWEDELVRDTGKKKTFTLKSGGEKIAGGAKPKAARTGIHPLGFAPGKDKAGGYSLVIAEIETGRTHQIRAQAASRGHPLGGDIKYGGRPFPGQKPREGGFFLHAWKITLCETGGEQGTLPEAFTAPPPVAFNKQVKHLFGEERKLFGN